MHRMEPVQCRPMPKTDPDQSRSISQGISLYTLLAAVVVLGILASVTVTQFTGSNAKGQAMLAFAENLGRAAKRFHLDTGCYPARISDLYEFSSAKNGGGCQSPLDEHVWHGPYIDPIDSNNTKQFGPRTTLDVDISPGGTRRVALRDPSPSVLKAALKACGEKNLTHGSSAQYGRCREDGDGDFFLRYLR